MTTRGGKTGYATVVLVGAAAGAIAALLLQRTADAPAPAQAPAEVSAEAAQVLRDERFASVSTIDDVLALPGRFSEDEALVALAARSDAAAVQDLLYGAMRVENTWRRDAMIGILIGRFVELDPQSAIAFAEGPLRRSGKDYASRAWRFWAERDFEAALAAARTSGDPEQMANRFYLALPSLDDPRAERVEAVFGVAPSTFVRSLAIEGVFSIDPARAVALLDSETRMSSTEAEKLAGLLVTERGAAALDVLRTIKSDLFRLGFEMILLEALTPSDPEAVIEWVFANKKSKDYSRQLGSALSVLAERDPDAALAFVEQAPEAQRDKLMTRVLSGLAETDAVLAIQVMGERGELPGNYELSQLMQRAAAQDLDGALMALTLIEDGQERATLLTELARAAPIERLGDLAAQLRTSANGRVGREQLARFTQTWMRRDAEAALAWVDTLPASDRDRVIGDAMVALSRQDGARAVDIATATPGRAGRLARSDLVAELNLRGNYDLALEAANGASSDTERQALLAKTLIRLARAEPDRAARLAAETGDPALADRVLASSITNQSDATDIADVFARTGGIQSAQLREQTRAQMVAKLAQKDFNAAMTFVDGLQPGADRDGALAGLTRAPDLSPAEALELADQIEDQALRDQAQMPIIFSLMRRDPDGAAEALENARLSPEMRKLLEQFTGSPGG